ncbi:hypothetical protein Lste_2932 [Legionella steelei]|uniref:SIR2-like domain-containing protein n=1 Tax=Legionella steelei TaxID=947033 RepID=A0A0W0ZD56_9GAMM|nr:hypothetical protein [Legionella steelei]KTD66726.1 hypothetical protein Lste_2932 [Legionella steelei]
MFNSETLFILGAGASAPYGYPLGKTLIQNIIDDMEDSIFIPKYSSKKSPPFWNKSDITHNTLYDFNECNDVFNQAMPYVDGVEQHHIRQQNEDGVFYIYFNQDDNLHRFHKAFFLTKIKNINIFNKLKRALEVFDPISIDAFLRDNPSYAKAGKIMILYSLLKREDRDKFNLNQSPDNWYSLLLNDLVSECADNPEKLSSNKVKFITFNYDVGLDFYLQTRIREIEIFLKTSEQSVSTADKFLEELEIKHVYGQLYLPADPSRYGLYFDSKDGNTAKRRANSDYSDPAAPSLNLIQNFKRFIYSFAQFNNIKTMYDERNNPVERDEMISSYRSSIQWANEIIFIGFGFDRDNLNLLGIPDNLWDFNQIFPGKTIRYLNYKGDMKSLAQEFEKLQSECKDLLDVNTHKYGNKRVNVIQSNANSICSAYQNDFKKFLFR